MTTFFDFEAEFVDSLRCIPMTVRMKLDTCGVKLKLSHWMQLTQPERMVLVNMACTTAAEAKIYRDFLQKLIAEKTGNPPEELAIDPDPAWLDDSQIPDTVREKAREFQIEISLEQWQKLPPSQRFALIKLKRGIEQDQAKKLSKTIRDSFPKAQASIQGDALRVTSKSKDELQAIIQLVKGEDFPLALQFTNYR